MPFFNWRDLFSGWGQPAQAIPTAPAAVILLSNPTFEKGVVVRNLVNGVSGALNTDYFATEETAQRVAQVFGARAVILQKAGGSGGLFSVEYPDGSPAFERYALFPAGSKLRNPDGSYFFTEAPFQENAGLLAAYFLRNPEKDFQNMIFGSLAAKFAWDVLRADHDYALKLKTGR